MSIWSEIKGDILEILKNHSDQKHGCAFISPYQLAVLYEQTHGLPNYKKEVGMGGDGEGDKGSFANYIARGLASEPEAEIAYFTRDGLQQFLFLSEDKIPRQPADLVFSIFRYRTQEKGN
jgi:hypothetical protein